MATIVIYLVVKPNDFFFLSLPLSLSFVARLVPTESKSFLFFLLLFPFFFYSSLNSFRKSSISTRHTRQACFTKVKTFVSNVNKRVEREKAKKCNLRQIGDLFNSERTNCVTRLINLEMDRHCCIHLTWKM